MLLKHSGIVATAANFNRTTLKSSESMGKSIKSSIQLNGQVKNTFPNTFRHFRGRPVHLTTNEDGDAESGPAIGDDEPSAIVQLSNRVQDGTRCRMGSLDMCIQGKCQVTFYACLNSDEICFMPSIEIYYACALWMCVERAAFNGRKCSAQNSKT